MNKDIPLTNVTLLCLGGDFNPQTITDILGITPTNTREKGKLITHSSGKTVTPKHSVWSPTKAVNAENLDSELEIFFASFNAQAIKKAAECSENIFFDIYVGASNNQDGNANFQFLISPHCLQLLNTLQIPVKISFDSGYD